MTPQFSLLTLQSAYQWLDYYLLTKGQAYTNQTTQFYYQPDPQLGSAYVAYASPFKSFVWDTGVAGATIFNGITGSWGGLTRGQDGLMTDFVNGRAILPASFGTTAVVSGSYAVKDFNVYFANQTQERMIFTNKYYLNGRFSNAQGVNGGSPTGIAPYSMVTPAIFVTNANSDNRPWAIGGLYNTITTISLNVLAENELQLEGALSLVVDSQDIIFPQVTVNQWPYNFYGDYNNSTGYSYESILAESGPGGNYTVLKVKASKVSDYVKIDEALFLGLADMTVGFTRLIH